MPDEYRFRVTNTVGASYTLTFEGNAVQLFGALYLDHGDYSVSIDGGAAEVFDGQFTQRDSRQYYLTALVRLFFCYCACHSILAS
jgi:hypothetical protein